MAQGKEIAAMPMRATRSGVSRKLLTRTALEKSDLPLGEPLEASFPSPASERSEGPARAPDAALNAPTVPPAPQPPMPAAWSSEDEAAFRTLLAKRKAAGYQRRGRDLSTQVLQPGSIKPNPDTVVATIVGLVSERKTLSRGELLGQMAIATFPHPKARPADKGWCQGYISGAIRIGYLTLVEKASAGTGGGA